ncbi:uncharacterized protein Z520_03277 [Fonsecaea multimorphosa CBS 102226]|uniref:4'-phosphopantetheinyl transferase domain-containing protein n=1 Tax=Fonsecaea multimorphosa CBS 102226 TaxID=1442371 RepID=A0A0D2KV41_9EURO|nr:uncharacterized protein Z520_03277 [Fonsecaea multimorphosa CBS 102226]KIY00614.1 hypothetical protein Z520_03277 [Fonsecaea multimorphosa CBS 102226]OAL19004.1 hypothetical protein AYO22_10333 [Fonsecaea multimorphosa]
MRAPFPLALRIGTDIVATNRIASLLQPDIRRLVRLTNRFLVAQELEDLRRRFPHWDDADRQDRDQLARNKQVAAWIAGRWASKEAAKKAWDASLLSFRDLRVGIEPDSGSVHIICDIAGLIQTSENASGHSTITSGSSSSSSSSSSSARVTEQTAQLSISHDGDYAIATVLATPLHADISAELARRKAEAEAKV